MQFPQNKSWDILRVDGVKVNFKVELFGRDRFTFDAWILETGQHVGVHSGHPHRPFPHLQVRSEMKGNAWQVFS